MEGAAVKGFQHTQLPFDLLFMQLSGKFFPYFDGISQVGGKKRAMAFGQSSNHLNARELEGERWLAEKVLIYHSELGSLMLH